ncbi:MAG: hypothetical protein R3C58_12935 [Parvularculaceae bacterium]
MKRMIALTAGALLFSTAAFADEVMEKCVAVVGPLGSPDPQGQCECFNSAMTDEQKAEYLALSDWDAEASDELKAIGAQCFPEIN